MRSRPLYQFVDSENWKVKKKYYLASLLQQNLETCEVATLGCKAKVTYVIAKGKRKWVAHTDRIHLSIRSTKRLAISRTGICSNSNGVQELVYEVCGGLRFESTTVRKKPHGLAVYDGTDADVGISMW